jgi:hypothetical protein
MKQLRPLRIIFYLPAVFSSARLSLLAHSTAVIGFPTYLDWRVHMQKKDPQGVFSFRGSSSSDEPFLIVRNGASKGSEEAFVSGFGQ